MLALLPTTLLPAALLPVALLAAGTLAACIARPDTTQGAVLEWAAASCLIAGLALIGLQLSALPL